MQKNYFNVNSCQTESFRLIMVKYRQAQQFAIFYPRNLNKGGGVYILLYKEKYINFLGRSGLLAGTVGMHYAFGGLSTAAVLYLSQGISERSIMENILTNSMGRGCTVRIVCTISHGPGQRPCRTRLWAPAVFCLT